MISGMGTPGTQLGQVEHCLTGEQLTRQFMCENIVKPRKATAQRKQKLFGCGG